MKRTAARNGLVVTALALVLCGCAVPGTSRSTSQAAASGAPAAPSSTAAPSAAAAESAAQKVPDLPFGPGCGAIPARGEGSFAGMADDPVATAMAHTPAATALTSAIAAAHLAASFDSQQDVTVLAPVHQAFEAVPRDSLRRLMGDTARLTAVLTHHVLQGRLTPDRLAGPHITLNNDVVTIGVTPEAFTVAAEDTYLGGAVARVVCGNVQTANATVYLIDQVLAPQA